MAVRNESFLVRLALLGAVGLAGLQACQGRILDGSVAPASEAETTGGAGGSPPAAGGPSASGGSGSVSPAGGSAGSPAACGAGQVECSGTCTSLEVDNANCGACASACALGQSCSGGGCTCSGGGVDCGAGCVDTLTDATNCGTCGNACSSGQSCVEGACQCLSGLSACTSGCVDLQSDATNCGACGNACGQGYVCSNGSCSLDCASGLAQCGQECVDTKTSSKHCGACNAACPAAQSCSGGECACTDGQALCGDQCVNTQSSNTHCGGCNQPCSGGQSCSGGACACPSGQTSCNGSCVNTQSSNAHCGGCNQACGTGQTCSAGTCQCGSGQTSCGGSCVNTQSSNAHCGGCNKPCSNGQTCSGGVCSGGPTGKAFSQCRFHFGTVDSKARNNAALTAQLDYFVPGWLGQANTFDMNYVCNDTKAGAVFQNLTPAVVAYVIAFKARRDAGLQDCNVSGNTNLCKYGATFIRQNRAAILDVYKSYAQGFASCYGTTKPMIWLMEPDFYQYHAGGDANALTQAEAGQLMAEIVSTVRSAMPNAIFSMDVSPWVGQNGKDNGAQWFGNFTMSDFTFINTSGGGTAAGNTRIRPENEMTWAGVYSVTKKPILADTGYGVAGTPTGHDANWDSVSNLNARIANGVVGIAQYNPNSNWGSTISSIRSQLGAVGCY